MPATGARWLGHLFIEGRADCGALCAHTEEIHEQMRRCDSMMCELCAFNRSVLYMVVPQRLGF